jgi:hypothetical protein
MNIVIWIIKLVMYGTVAFATSVALNMIMQ